MHTCPNCGAQVDEAEVQCSRCGLIFSDKKTGEMFLRRADAYLKIGDVEKASEFYEKAMKYDIPSAKIGYARIAFGAEKYEDAIEVLESMDGREALEILSAAYYRLGKYEDSARCLKKLVKIDEKNPAYLKNLGLCLQKMERHEEAVEYLERCADISGDAQSIHMLAESLYHLGKIEDAAKKMEVYAEMTGDARAYIACAELYAKMEKFQHAVRCVDKALGIEENDSFWVMKGDLELHIGMPLKAISHYDTALRLNEKNASAWSHKSIAFEYIDRYDEALVCAKKSLEIDPKNIEVKKNMGEILLKMHRYSEAIKIFEEISSIKDDYYVHLKIGEAKMSMGKYAEACEELKKSIEMNGNVYDSWVALAVAYFNLGQYQECLDSCNRALNIKKDDPFVWYIKGSAHFMLEEYEYAYKDAETSLNLNDKFLDAKKLLRQASERLAGEGKTYQIEDIFIIYGDGRLLTHISRNPERTVDDEILSGMLTAVQQFIKEAFRFEGGGILEKMEIGEILILIEHWESLFAAVIVSGEDNPYVRRMMKKTLKEIYDKYYTDLKDWDGDIAKIRGINDILVRNLLIHGEGG